jgi:hypothetical protein
MTLSHAQLELAYAMDPDTRISREVELILRSTQLEECDLQPLSRRT